MIQEKETPTATITNTAATSWIESGWAFVFSSAIWLHSSGSLYFLSNLCSIPVSIIPFILSQITKTNKHKFCLLKQTVTFLRTILYVFPIWSFPVTINNTMAVRKYFMLRQQFRHNIGIGKSSDFSLTHGQRMVCKVTRGVEQYQIHWGRSLRESTLPYSPS